MNRREICAFTAGAAGAGEVLVFDRTCNDQRLCYRRSGIEAAVREESL